MIDDDDRRSTKTEPQPTTIISVYRNLPLPVLKTSKSRPKAGYLMEVYTAIPLTRSDVPERDLGSTHSKLKPLLKYIVLAIILIVPIPFIIRALR